MRRATCLSLSALALLCACRRAPVPNPMRVGPVTVAEQNLLPSDLAPGEVSIDLQEVFDGDTVKVLVNDKLVYSGVLTTPDGGTGLTHSLRCQAPGQACALSVLIGRQEWRSSIDLAEGRHLGVGYIEGNVRIVQSKTPMLYD